jgi:hypothetical protein
MRHATRPLDISSDGQSGRLIVSSCDIGAADFMSRAIDGVPAAAAMTARIAVSAAAQALSPIMSALPRAVVATVN